MAFPAAPGSATRATLPTRLVGFDVKNGIKRTQAATDAQAQIDEYFTMAGELYESRAPKSQSAAKSVPPPAVPTPTPASAPKQ